MTYFLLSGDEEPSLTKMERLLEDRNIPSPLDPRPQVRMEAENFYSLQGYEVVYPDRQASQRIKLQLASEGATGRIKAVFNEVYTASGRYDVRVRYRDGNVGSSTFQLLINGQQQGASWSASAQDDSWKSRNISDVALKQGDELEVVATGDGEERAELDYIALTLRPTDPSPAPAPSSACEIVNTDGDVMDFSADGQEVRLPKDWHRAIAQGLTQPGYQLSLYEWYGSTSPFAEVQGSMALDPGSQVKKVKCEALDAPAPDPDPQPSPDPDPEPSPDPDPAPSPDPDPAPAPSSACEIVNTDGDVMDFSADGEEVRLPKDWHRAIAQGLTQPGYQLSLYEWYGSTSPFAEVQGSMALDPGSQVKKVKCEALDAPAPDPDPEPSPDPDPEPSPDPDPAPSPDPDPAPAPSSACEVVNTDGDVMGFSADGEEVQLPKDWHRAIAQGLTQPGYQLSLYEWYGSTSPFAEVQGNMALDPGSQVKKVKCEAL